MTGEQAPRSSRRTLAPSAAVRRKAARLLVEGRVQVLAAGLLVDVEGDTAAHRVTVDGHQIRCDCPARATCAHATAVRLITAGAP